ncbi:MAG: SMP-30/gluconolactonase/LRE family protein [Bryobacteraceae bacterium]
MTLISKWRRTSLAALCFALPVLGANAVVKLDPSLDQVVATNAKLDVLKSDYFGLSEGPVWVKDGKGYLLFSDIGANAIYKWTPENTLSVYMEKSGYTGDVSAISLQGYVASNGRLNISNFGSNGIVLDPQGRLILCAQGDRAIVRIEKDGKRTVLADRFEGKRFNRPNDLVLKSNGSIYFTDPWAANNPNMDLPGPRVFLLKDGVVKLLLSDFRLPNGVALSPDEKVLYVNDTLRKVIMRYDVQPDDTISNGQVFIDMSTDKTPGNPDGMKVDQLGNVYSTGPGGIWIMNSSGKHIGTILLPETATNLNFGDADGKTLYITDRKSFAKIRLKITGALWK